MDNYACGLAELYRQRFPNPKTLDEFREYEDLLKQKLARCENRMQLDYLQGDYSYRAKKKAEKEGLRLRTKAGKLSFKLKIVQSEIEKLEWEEVIKRNSDKNIARLFLNNSKTSARE